MRSVRKLLVGVGIVAVLVGAWAYHDTREAVRPIAQARAEIPLELTVGEPIHFKNLSLFPVTSNVLRDQDRFITLGEGLRSGLVSITEVGAPAEDPFVENASPQSGGDAALEPAAEASSDPFDADGDVDGNVNELLVTNNSDRPLYLMPGEIVSGGKQDRAIADEFVVAPRTQRLSIQVYCVEHGRWLPRNDQGTVQLALTLSGIPAAVAAIGPTAAQKGGGEFSQAAGYMNKKGRLVVQSGQGQSAVWDEVSAVNDKSGARTNSDALTANYSDMHVVDKLTPYLTALETPIAQQPQVVGVIVAINGEIQAADTFESTPLFRKLWPKLLQSYVLDAATESDEEFDESQLCDVAAARSFLRGAVEAKVADSKDREGLVTTRGESQEIASFSLHESRPLQASGAMGGMGGAGFDGGAFGSGVHSAAFAK